MKRFVFGSAEQFAVLKQSIEGGRCISFKDCAMPQGTKPSTATLVFGRGESTYFVKIDQGLRTRVPSAEYKMLLRNGKLEFIAFDDLITFFHGLQPYFSEQGLPRVVGEVVDVPVQNQGGGVPVPLQSPAQSGNAVDAPQTVDNAVPLAPAVTAPSPEELQNMYDPKAMQVLETAENKPKKAIYPTQIADKLKESIYGQDQAIESIAEKIAMNKMRKTDRLISIVLFGPTGTGKTATGKCLAEVLTKVYGTSYDCITIRANEFTQENNVSSLIGAPPGYVGYGKPTLLESVRKNPAVIVVDEIEKANEKLLVVLMEALDGGFLGMADNSPAIDLRQCIILFTSNIPIDMGAYRAANKFEKGELCRDVLTQFTNRPEISGKIGHFVSYEELSSEAKSKIILKCIYTELKNHDINLQGVAPELLYELRKNQTKYGARGLELMISDSIAHTLFLQEKLERLQHHSVMVDGTPTEWNFTIVETKE